MNIIIITTSSRHHHDIIIIIIARHSSMVITHRIRIHPHARSRSTSDVRARHHAINRSLVRAQALSRDVSPCVFARAVAHCDKVATGGEDAWFALGRAFGVADGVGGFNALGVDPGAYAKALAVEAARASERSGVARSGARSAGDVKAIAIEAQRTVKLPGAATFVMCALNSDGVLRIANVGDCGARVIRDGKVREKTRAQQHYFNCPYQLAYEELNAECDVGGDAEMYEFACAIGDVVVVASDGLFDNVFDDDIGAICEAAFAGESDVARASMACAEALATKARAHAEDKKYDSPYARERAKSATDAGGAPKASGLFGGLNKMLGGDRNLGGKMDDITVVVATVVNAAQAQKELAASEATCAENMAMLERAREASAVEEIKVARTVALRKEMDSAFKENVAKSEAKAQAMANAKTEFTRAQVDAMDAPTVRKLLQERGLPTSGKIERLRDRLAEVKAL